MTDDAREEKRDTVWRPADAGSGPRLVSEPIVPDTNSFDTASMARGAPGVPGRFTWRGREFRVRSLLNVRKNLRPCRSGSAERYVNKHFYDIETETGERMTIYRTRSGSLKDSWMLYTIDESGSKAAPADATIRPLRLAVLVSGGGTNLQAIIDAAEADRIAGMAAQPPKEPDFEVILVIADREGCYALERAKRHGIPSETAIPPAGVPRPEARRAVSDRILALAKDSGADALILAGFLTILSGPIIEAYANRIVNLHPALLPKFGGKGMWGHHVHEAVLAAGETESGCTVHLVDSGCDTGPILLQRKVPVQEGDTPDSLAERIHGEEHRAIVEGVRELAIRLRGGRRG